MRLVPEEQIEQVEQVEQVGGNMEVSPPTEPRTKPFEKITKLIHIILKLANSKAYNLDRQIRLKDGSYMQNSDIITLLNYAMTPGRVIIGENEFIQLLYEAHITPDLIINDNLRPKLVKFETNYKSEEPRVTVKRKIDDEIDDEVVPLKRQRLEEPEEPIDEPRVPPITLKRKKDRWAVVNNKRKLDWTMPDDE